MQNNQAYRSFFASMSAARIMVAALALLIFNIFAPERAGALSATEALEYCRMTTGRPVLRACILRRLERYGGYLRQHLQACRETASPAVRSCFQTAMKDVIADCRISVGKPIVEACVRARIAVEGRFLIEQVQDCRKSAFAPVRACVWRASAMDL